MQIEDREFFLYDSLTMTRLHKWSQRDLGPDRFYIRLLMTSEGTREERMTCRVLVIQLEEAKKFFTSSNGFEGTKMVASTVGSIHELNSKVWYNGLYHSKFPLSDTGLFVLKGID